MIAIVSNSNGTHLESVGCGIIFIVVVCYAYVYSVVISMSMTFKLRIGLKSDMSNADHFVFPWLRSNCFVVWDCSQL
jgi:hypothetical protein